MLLLGIYYRYMKRRINNTRAFFSVSQTSDVIERQTGSWSFDEVEEGSSFLGYRAPQLLPGETIEHSTLAFPGDRCCLLPNDGHIPSPLPLYQNFICIYVLYVSMINELTGIYEWMKPLGVFG